MYSLTFNKHINYPHSESAIEIDVILSINKTDFIGVNAKLDTGSTFCIFQRRFAEALKLKVEDGEKESIRTAKGSFTAFGHEVNLSCLDIEWTTTVYFAQDESFPVNVLGRRGFLQVLKIGLVEYEQILYLSPYNE